MGSLLLSVGLCTAPSDEGVQRQCPFPGSHVRPATPAHEQQLTVIAAPILFRDVGERVVH